jgi:hypothetical protein
MQDTAAAIAMVGFGEAAHAFAIGWDADVRRGLCADDLRACRSAVQAGTADPGLICTDVPAALLVSRPHVDRSLARGARVGVKRRSEGALMGRATTINLQRSVMIKGFEARMAAFLLAARRARVEGQVLASLRASDPGWNWRDRGAHILERTMVHGARRAAEMAEVALTLRDLGLSDGMARAKEEWQALLAALGLPGGADNLTDRADRILARLP